MRHIARPDVTMNISGGGVHHGVALLGVAASRQAVVPLEDHLANVQRLIQRTKHVAAVVMRCSSQKVHAGSFLSAGAQRWRRQPNASIESVNCTGGVQLALGGRHGQINFSIALTNGEVVSRNCSAINPAFHGLIVLRCEAGVVSSDASRCSSPASAVVPSAGTVDDATCEEMKHRLETTYVQTYVKLTRLVSDYEDLVRSTACEDTVTQEWHERRRPLQEQVDELSDRISRLTEELRSLRPRLTDASNAESLLREQVAALTSECALLPETISDLDSVRDTISTLARCPGLEAAEFHIPLWVGEWQQIMQDPQLADAELDARMDEMCQEAYPDAGIVRAAEVSEIIAQSIEGMPTANSAEIPVIGKCPLCDGNSDAATGVWHQSGHARVCWDPKSEFVQADRRLDCSTGNRAVMCVVDRGDIRKLTREEMKEGFSPSPAPASPSPTIEPESLDTIPTE